MKRQQLKQIQKWLLRPHRKPLIIRGARQVGKSTLVRLFSQYQSLPLTEINLERHPALASTFQGKNPLRLIDTLEALPNLGKITKDGLLFLDEIQAVPEAIPMLRYLYEDLPQQAVIAAGSLLEFVLSDHHFSMPVGRVEYLHMGPMTFTEFLGALGEEKLLQCIEAYKLPDKIEPLVHQRLLELLRIYFFVGGMPEAVKLYAETRRLYDVSQVHNSIIETYREDFPKYCGSRNLARIQHVFNFAARNIGKKVKYSHYSHHDKSATIKEDIELLSMARVVAKVVHSHCNGLPLQAEIEEKVYKLIFLDIGLMNAIGGLGWNTISNMNDHSLVNEGTMAEQFIAQHLQVLLSGSPNRELNYWLREGRSSNAEVDFVIGIHGRILPIEIKAGASGGLKSLHQFVGEKNVSQAIRFDAGLPSVQEIKSKIKKGQEVVPVHYRLISLPLYLVERLPELMMQEK